VCLKQYPRRLIKPFSIANAFAGYALLIGISADFQIQTFINSTQTSDSIENQKGRAVVRAAFYQFELCLLGRLNHAFEHRRGDFRSAGLAALV
jgi:hypothetical protein